MLEKRVLTILKLNWNQRLGHKKTNLNICHHMLTSSTQLQNRSFHVVERTRTSAKCQKMKYARAKRAKDTVFHCQICKFLRFLLPSSSWLLRARSIQPKFPGQGSKISWGRMDRDGDRSRSSPLSTFLKMAEYKQDKPPGCNRRHLMLTEDELSKDFLKKTNYSKNKTIESEVNIFGRIGFGGNGRS